MKDIHDEHDLEADWSIATQALVRAARQVHDPSVADRARVDAAMASRLSGPRSTGGKMLGLRRLGGGAVLKVTCGVLLATGVSLLGLRASEPRSEPKAERSHAKFEVAAQQIAGAASPVLAAPAPPALASASDSKLPRPPRRRGSALKTVTSAPDKHGELGGAAVSAGTVPAVARDRPGTPDDTHAPVLSAAAASQEVGWSPVESADPQTSWTRFATSRRDSPDDEHAELKLVADMHAALRLRDFAAALALCAEHARRWPRGVFELEREGVRVIALCGARALQADVRATRYLSEHPNAPLTMRVRAACASQLTATQSR